MKTRKILQCRGDPAGRPEKAEQPFAPTIYLIFLILTMAVFLFFAIFVQKKVDIQKGLHKKQGIDIIVPSGQYMKIAVLGYNNVIADLYYLKERSIVGLFVDIVFLMISCAVAGIGGGLYGFFNKSAIPQEFQQNRLYIEIMDQNDRINNLAKTIDPSQNTVRLTYSN